MADRIDRCADCGDWRWEGWCWTCYHAARGRLDRYITNTNLINRIKEAA